MNEEEGCFNVVVVGTGLVESIIAAALAHAGLKVAHIDESSYYGGEQASLNLSEFADWARERHGVVTLGEDISPLQSRQFSVSLAPTVIPSTGPLIDALVASGVARYGGFNLVQSVAMYTPAGVHVVPGSKEDVFKDKSITLLDKRRLMRFLSFAAGEFEGDKDLDGRQDVPFGTYLRETFHLNDDLTSAVAYALAYCKDDQEPTYSALLRIRSYLRSSGRYGASPFLIGHYGGSGEISQGFCRSAAVKGGVYVLGRRILSITPIAQPVESSTDGQRCSSRARFNVALDDFPLPMTCDVVVGTHPHFLPPPKPDCNVHGVAVARCVAIIDQPLSIHPSSQQLNMAAPDTNSTPTSNALPVNNDGTPDSTAPTPQTTVTQVPPTNASTPINTGILVFPPRSLRADHGTTVTVLIEGETTMATPKDRWILYITMPLEGPIPDDPEKMLRPYLEMTLSLAATPAKVIFSAFYVQSPASVPASVPASSHSTLPRVSSDAVSISSSYIPVAPQPYYLPLPEYPDHAARCAERLFWDTVAALRSLYPSPGSEDLGSRNAQVAEVLHNIDTLWPPQEPEESTESDDGL
ncbi:FAD/NAD(P)-binding domain-containing protein [Fistulina hepatica ATCC 64428]|uniref:FAD/NAD(P)-binding domain-containing protein n=1 Tax=Fistulina hepatica ATCC 64428 TaxID=1128425 RepID=A0A0D7A6P8_9AGAR|nr:FAD/NAD(P)-binding domain-containing protein [Fistulina hepatica ATCC 64428]